MQSKIVSVVVPIYKVEEYLPRCIKSILSQTYKNLEIILVNDGSPDQCGLMAEQYAKQDQRVKVIHKKNGGLSDARNYGMRHVTGEYTLFVDSDDWIEKNAIEELVWAIEHFKADLVQSAFYYAYDDYLLFDHRYYSIGNQPLLLTNRELMKELIINERVKNFAWGKLYKTEMIKEISFKNGVLFEDVFWSHLVMEKVEKFVLLQKPLWNYYQREGSIVSNYTLKNLDFLEGLKVRVVFIKDHYPELLNEAINQLLKMSLIHYHLLLLNRKKDKAGMKRKEIKNYIYTHYDTFRNAAVGEPKLMRELKYFKWHPVIYILYLVYKKIARILKITFDSERKDLIKIEKSKGEVFE